MSTKEMKSDSLPRIDEFPYFLQGNIYQTSVDPYETPINPYITRRIDIPITTSEDIGAIDHIDTELTDELEDEKEEKAEVKKENKGENKTINILNRTVATHSYELDITILNKYNIRLLKFISFSCGVVFLGGLESIYSTYGIEGIKDLMNFIIKRSNIEIDNYNISSQISKSEFAMASVTNRYPELRTYLFSISNCASDTVRNRNSSNNITVFTIKLN